MNYCSVVLGNNHIMDLDRHRSNIVEQIHRSERPVFSAVEERLEGVRILR